MPTITIAKYGDRITATPKAGEDEKRMIARLCQEHGAGAVFVDNVAVSELRAAESLPAAASTKPAPKKAKKKASKKAAAKKRRR